MAGEMTAWLEQWLLFKEPVTDSQHPAGGLQCLELQLLFQDIQHPILSILGTRHACAAQTYVKAKHSFT